MFNCIDQLSVWHSDESSTYFIFVYYDFKTKEYKISDRRLKDVSNDFSYADSLFSLFGEKLMLAGTYKSEDFVGVELYNCNKCKTYAGIYADTDGETKYCLALFLPKNDYFSVSSIGGGFSYFDSDIFANSQYIVVECSGYTVLALINNKKLAKEILQYMRFKSTILFSSSVIISSLKGISYV